jgi:ABC-type transport system involved in multi-copper enzyme maturation permease subunit
VTFLPIVERELRAAARKPSTYRARTAMVVLTSLIAAVLLLMAGSTPAGRFGASLFSALFGLAFIFCLLAGARYAADSLSEEKREGTLGLLFLTDLRGYDVVLGKLVAVSARTVQALVAFLPVLSIALVMGGITAGEFWRAAAVLTNTLFFSLCAGLWVSSVSRQAHTALAGTLALLLLLTTFPLVANSMLSWISPATAGYAALISPATSGMLASDFAYRAEPARYWGALLVSHLVGWAFLFFASAALPHSWQDRITSPRNTRTDLEKPRNRSTTRLRHRLLDINPVYWLAARHENQRLVLWAFVGAVTLAGAISVLVSGLLGGTSLGLFTILNFGLILVLKLWVAWHASATLAEARQTGAVELLLATPLTVEEIIRGHWLALQRIFFWPVIAAVLLSLLPILELVFREPPSSAGLFLFPVPAAALFGIATLIMDLVALAWVGMWMGLSQPRRIQAFARTVLWVIVIPTVVVCLPNIVFDLFWIAWARRKLEHEFRRTAMDRYTPPAAPTPLPFPGALPPVIAR